MGKRARQVSVIGKGTPDGELTTLAGEMGRLLASPARLVGECPCESGCPSCVQSPKCGNLHEPLHKAGSLELMEGMINAIAAVAR